MTEYGNHEVELNLFYLHIRDAEKAQEYAAQEQSKLKSFFARQSILSTMFAFEALINKVYADFHPKTGYFIPAIKTPWSITVMGKNNKEVPWIETQSGPVWPHTHIPKNPFELNKEHATKALQCFRDMLKELLRLFEGVFLEDWLWEMKLKEIDSGKIERVSIDSLWGGYTP